jgi:putative PIN family toxin of toxin-antitoxin system
VVVTLDTNIYISALHFGKGKPLQILQMAVDGDLHVAISPAILNEVLRVMKEKFHATREDLHEAEALITGCTERVQPTETLTVVKEDPDDDRILDCAVASGSGIIVSGDGDLLRLCEHAGIRIVSPAEFLKTLTSGGSPGRRRL